jgi:hypothetical protein
MNYPDNIHDFDNHPASPFYCKPEIIKTYKVTLHIEAAVELEVEAVNEDDAMEIAQRDFDLGKNDIELFSVETNQCEEV